MAQAGILISLNPTFLLQLIIKGGPLAAAGAILVPGISPEFGPSRAIRLHFSSETIAAPMLPDRE